MTELVRQREEDTTRRLLAVVANRPLTITPGFEGALKSLDVHRHNFSDAL
ncbi:hypothetical protein PUV44_06025 [Xanthomonas arboricola pv. corylina]|nr:hypothetical protein [Xanthomonas arboricola]MDN0222344.1 hypothetical protein [Xanthomonas arboricola pv. juglandis]MDN0224760.1 hypothetical protein [Xanthomonas arboricola pv. juglandis]MDN0230839.1 hypothetical protein [Xanthomonas arboricola pv. juglandis]MDN0233117.1 hypothetical protein [Xanthomonas arboricola pv. juglandis]MDN0239344.1 hypothetical protein [Xanthomonas arboricola pv. juglandis]